MQVQVKEGREALAKQFGLEVQGADFVRYMPHVEMRLVFAATGDADGGFLMTLCSPYFGLGAKPYDVGFPDLKSAVSAMSNDNLTRLLCHNVRHHVKKRYESQIADLYSEVGPVLGRQQEHLDIDLDEMCRVALAVFEAELL